VSSGSCGGVGYGVEGSQFNFLRIILSDESGENVRYEWMVTACIVLYRTLLVGCRVDGR